MDNRYALLEMIEVAADKAISVNPDLHMVLGRAYHQLANEIFEATGVDPRPYHEVFNGTR